MIVEIPGLAILGKYGQQLVSNDNLKTIVETSGIVSHFDRQRIFGMGWKQDKIKNRFIFDMLLCK